MGELTFALSLNVSWAVVLCARNFCFVVKG